MLTFLMAKSTIQLLKVEGAREMSELVLLHCGKNDFTTGPMPIRTAAAYIAEAVLDGMDCVGSHSVLEFQTVPADFVVPFPYVPELEPLWMADGGRR